MKYSILRNKNKSYGSKNVENIVGVDIQQTTKQFTHNDIVGTIDANEQFLKERDRCKDYRLVLTINPFCSNELFNTCTEITWKEGSDDCINIVDNEFYSFNTNDFYPVKERDIIGKSSNIKRSDMVRNTEYSSENIGFEYHPGYDIFNNHIIRNKSYRIVNPLPKQITVQTKNNFNTLNDYMRLANGSYITKCTRFNIEDTTFVNKHLYDRDDILEFENGESKEENLREENGWFGFYNTSVIPSKSKSGNILDFNRVINNEGNCSFVDMYPDRSLFSFIPKYNKYKNRLEENWDIELTYAFDSTVKFENKKDIELVQSKGVNALAIASVEYVINQTGVNVLLFRCYTKHNLKPNDNVFLYFSEDENQGDWIRTNRPYRVLSTGDMNGNFQDYYFAIYDSELLNNIFATSRDENYTDWDYVRDYFYNPVNVGDIDVTKVVRYGDRGLTNIPSADDVYVEVGGNYYEMYSHDTGKSYNEMRTEAQTNGKDLSATEFIMFVINNAFTVNDTDTSQSSLEEGDNTQYDVYISFRFTKAIGNMECQYYVRKFKKLPNIKNGHSGLENMPYDKEKYRLGYAETIYGDSILQSVFTDNINVTGLTNNLGYEPREIFATIVKTNVGHNEWYATDSHCSDYEDENKVIHRVEYSHCFGNVTCGFDLFGINNDKHTIKQNRRNLYDVKFINNDPETSIKTMGNQYDITIDNDWFYGDVVEFNPARYTETVLCDVNFRFNTMQRELNAYPTADIEKYMFEYDELVSDDYDKDGFNVDSREQTLIQLAKKEGYYYKPHYRIKLKGNGPVIQDSYLNIMVRDAEPIQNNGIYIKISTSLRHNCAVNDQLVLKDNASSREWRLTVLSVLTPYSFVMSKVERDDDDYVDWITICNFLNNNGYSLKRVNQSIPDYASRVNSNTFVWREPTNAWDIDNEDTDLKEYVFTNGCLYIDEIVNFYLKRQDPNNENDLWVNEISYPYVTDVYGETNKIESIYPYKEDYEAIC